MRILAFGIVKEIVGGQGIEIPFEENQRVGDLRLFLNTRYPRLLQLAFYLIAVNDEYAEEDLAISANDEIAVIPPVSGG